MAKKNKLTPEYFYKLLVNSGRHKGHAKYYALLVFVVFLVTAVNSPRLQDALVEGQPGLYTVLHVSDGDTIVVDMGNVEQTVRLIGVDTPETHHPQKPVQCFGEAASEFTTALVEGKQVRLEADEQTDNRDRYDRLLRYVYIDGTLVNAEIIRQGYGFALNSFPHSQIELFRSLEKQARNQKAGLWSGCDLLENEYGSYETAPKE